MKRVTVMMVCALIALNVLSQKNFKDLVGRWEIVGEQDSGACLEVIDSVNMILIYNGETRKIKNYQIDFTRSPIWFDFSTGDSTSVVAVKSLLEIMNDTMIKWQLFVDEDRSPHFSSTKGELFYLRKAKTAISTSIVAN